MEHLADIVKAYDIRGLVDSQLTPETAHALGRACAVEFAGEAMIVGMDMRPSSPQLAGAFAEGVRAQGVDTIDLGLSSTDMIYYAAGQLGHPGAMWSASHNPAEYNGLKLCRAGAEPVSIDTGLAQIRDRAIAGDFPAADTAGAAKQMDLLADFAAHVRSFVDTSKLRPLKVAVDAGNGMAGHVLPKVFEPLPFDVVPLYFDLDGTFPNHPANPIEPDNLRDLQAAVREHSCDIGLAFDGDADRVFCVDEHGKPIPPSLITALIAERMLGRNPGSTVLYNLICSRVVPETIERAGGTPLRTRVGHSFIKALMADTDAVFAGEHSAHYYFRDNYRADSGLIAALILLEALSESDGPASAAVVPYDKYVASGEINSKVPDAHGASERVAAAFQSEGEADMADGLTVTADQWWFNLRPSNTEPVLRLNVEADDVETMERIRDRVLGLISS